MTFTELTSKFVVFLLILFGQVVQFSAANRDEQIFTLTSDFGQFKILKQTKANYLAKFFGRKGKAGTYFALFTACRTFELRGKPHTLIGSSRIISKNSQSERGISVRLKDATQSL